MADADPPLDTTSPVSPEDAPSPQRRGGTPSGSQEADGAAPVGPLPGLSRREVLRRVGIAGAFTVGGAVLGHEFLPHRHPVAAAEDTHAGVGGAGVGVGTGDGAGAGVGDGPYAGSGLSRSTDAQQPPAALVGTSAGSQHGLYGHGAAAPASLRADDLDAVTRPPAFDGRQGVTRTYDLSVAQRRMEVAEGTVVEAWTYGGSVPGPIIRATEGDRLRIRMANHTSHAHNVHLHGRHDPAMDGWEPIPPGAEFTYEVVAEPFGLHPYHCHTAPIAEHIGRGLYGAMIIDPPGGRPPAHEVVLVLGGWDLDGDGRNDVVAFNGVAGAYHRFPIRVPVGELVRVYVVNLLEHDPIASFHLHAQTFDVYRSGTSLTPDEHTDILALTQGERAVLEFRLPEPGRYMFHPHQSSLADRGAMGWFAAV